jgi:predicted aspartyl protease
MSFEFDPHANLILVNAKLFGPARNLRLRLALDTGATTTLINQSRLMRIGYDPAASSERVQITTGSNVEFVARITLNRLKAFGQDRTDFPVLCHNLPPTASVDKLLGLDFFRGLNLNIDFRNGLITIT